MGQAWVLCALGLVLAGCLGERPVDGPSESAPVAWVGPNGDCGTCTEPTLASDGAYLYATAAFHEQLFRGFDGRWETLPPPRTGLDEGDIFVQVDDDGRLWWSSLVLSPARHDTQVHVARSDDQGATWAVSTILPFGPADQAAGGAADRPWLAIEGDRVLAVCTCPVVGFPQMRISEDAGATFGDPVPLSGAIAGRPPTVPLGPPAVGPDGAIVVPFFVAGPLSVAALRSTDRGDSWQRVTIWEPAAGLAGAAACCAFPNSAGGPQGFLVAFALAEGDLMLARSTDGLEWSVDRIAASSTLPHPWPVWVGDQPALAWRDRSDDLHVTIGATDVVVGTANDVDPWDYVTATTHRGELLTSWPREGGLGVGGVSVPAATPSPYPASWSAPR